MNFGSLLWHLLGRRILCSLLHIGLDSFLSERSRLGKEWRGGIDLFRGDTLE